MNKNKPFIVVIVGPTASVKQSLASNWLSVSMVKS